MRERPLRTTVVGSYPLPGWLELAAAHLDALGPADVQELQDDAVLAAVHDQTRAGLDVITDGEQTRLDFNLSFYGQLEGVDPQPAPTRRLGPPAHDQRGQHRVNGELTAPRGLGVVAEFERLRRLAPTGVALKASIPGPYTLSGRLLPGPRYPDRYALTEALLPLVARELEALVAAGCREICVDEPSMSCYAHREDPIHFVDIFRRTVAGVLGRCRLSTHLCFGNYKARAAGPRRYAPLFPAVLELPVDELHVEMASREFAEIERIGEIAASRDVAVGIVDVKSSWVEPVEEVADRVRRCLRHAPAERLSFAPDCGLSQTARFVARAKLRNLVAGVSRVREELFGDALVIEPLLADDAFLTDVAASREKDGVRLWWLGQSGFLVQSHGRHLLLDPYLSDSLTRKYAATDKPHVRMTARVVAPERLDFVDVVASSHNHTDHLDAETLVPLLEVNPGLAVVVPEANRAFAAARLGIHPSRLLGLDDGLLHEVPGFAIHAVPAAHEEISRDAEGRCHYLGYVVRCGGTSLYHAGDCVPYPGQIERLRPFAVDVALLPINGRAPERRVPGNFWGAEAAVLGNRIAASLVIPCHYDMFAFNTATPDAFVDEARRLGLQHRVLRAGERVDV